MGSISRSLSALLGFVLFCVAVWIIYWEVERLGVKLILNDLRVIPPPALFLSAVLTLLSYVLLSTYEVLGFRYIERSLSYARIVFAAFIGYGFSNSISMTPSVAVRYRIYSTWGISKLELTKLVAFHMLSTWLGFFLVGGLILLINPSEFAGISPLTIMSMRLLGVTMLSLVTAYFTVASLLKKPFKFRSTELRFPSHRLVLLQLLLGSLDWALVGVALFVLLPNVPQLSYQRFLGFFILAQLIQILSHVPGGLGVFEGCILLFLKPIMPGSAVLGALIVYRVVYHLVPLCLATLFLGGFEVLHRGEK